MCLKTLVGIPPIPINLKLPKRLEAILNFQHLSCDLTGLDLALPRYSAKPPPLPKQWRLPSVSRRRKTGFYVADDVFPKQLW